MDPTGSPAVADGASEAITVVCYTDAQELGGAELSLEYLLEAPSPRIAAAVVGTDRAVVGRLAAARPGTSAIVVPRPIGRLAKPSLEDPALGTGWRACHGA